MDSVGQRGFPQLQALLVLCGLAILVTLLSALCSAGITWAFEATEILRPKMIVELVGTSTNKKRAHIFLIFSPTAKANGVFSPDKLRCVSVRVAGAGSGGRFRKVPESSGVCWCRFRRRVPEGSGGFRRMLAKVPEAGSGRFRRVPVCAGLGSGRLVPEIDSGDGSGGRFRKVPESSAVK